VRVIPVPTNPKAYSSRVYLLLGDFNALPDVNTLIDTGGDPWCVNEIKNIYTGAGKKALSKVIITHLHFDHTGGIKGLMEAFNPQVMAFGKDPVVHQQLYDGEIIKVADTNLQVMYIPEHSNDSICLYNWDTKILFSGDTPLDIKMPGRSHSHEFVPFIEKLLDLGVSTIYPGHGLPMENGSEMLYHTYKMIRQA
jgi:glyoxylase-like metal-dependent hydrolase (beta-lactamase superfamily II)